MARHVYVAMFLYAQMATGFIMPMTKPNGDVDVSSMVGHIALLEQSMATLQTQVQTSHSLLTAELKSAESDLRAVQTELATTKSEVSALNTKIKTTELELTSARTELKITTDSLHAVETRLRSAESEVLTLKNDKQLRPSVVDLAMMKTDLAELKSVSKIGFNISVMDSIGNDVKSNAKDIENLKSRISDNSKNINNSQLDLELNAQDQRDLRRRCDSTGMLVNMTQRELQRFKVTQHVLWTNMSARINTKNTTEDLASLKLLILKARSNIAFHALQSSFNITNSTTPVKLYYVYLNNGGGYSSSTGYFTAPVAGTYMFWMHFVLQNLQADCRLKKYPNWQFAYGIARTSSSIQWNTAGATGAIHMNVGEKVYFACNSVGAVWHSHFGGTILHAD